MDDNLEFVFIPKLTGIFRPLTDVFLQNRFGVDGEDNPEMSRHPTGHFNRATKLNAAAQSNMQSCPLFVLCYYGISLKIRKHYEK